MSAHYAATLQVPGSPLPRFTQIFIPFGMLKWVPSALGNKTLEIWSQPDYEKSGFLINLWHLQGKLTLMLTHLVVQNNHRIGCRLSISLHQEMGLLYLKDLVEIPHCLTVTVSAWFWSRVHKRRGYFSLYFRLSRTSNRFFTRQIMILDRIVVLRIINVFSTFYFRNAEWLLFFSFFVKLLYFLMETQ